MLSPKTTIPVLLLLLVSLNSAGLCPPEQENSQSAIPLFSFDAFPLFTLTIGLATEYDFLSGKSTDWLTPLANLQLSRFSWIWPEEPPRKNALLAPPPQKRGPGPGWRAFFSNLALITVSTANYWFIQQETMQVDWDYEPTWSDQKKRFLGFSAWRFDSNYFRVNWTHAPAGAVYYTLARSNSLSSFQSLLYSLALSSFWEYVSEFREVISINDQVFSPLGGFPIGENLFQISEMLRAKKGGWLTDLLSWLINFPGRANNMIWGDNGRLTKRPRFAALEDQPGHGLRLAAGRLTGGEQSGPAFWLGGQSRLVTIPGYLEQGCRKEWLSGDSMSFLDFNLVLNREFSGSARTTYLGFLAQRIEPDEANRRRGFAFYLGPWSGFELSQQKYPALSDKFSAVHLIGPLADLVLYSKDFTLQVQLAASVHFSMVESLALDRYQLNNDLEGTKTTLHEHGYYFAFGPGFSSSLSFKWGGLETGGSFHYLDFHSIQGLDRYREEISNDFPLKDRALLWRLHCSWQPPSLPFYAFLSWERLSRRGWIAETSGQGRRDRLAAGLGHVF
jgi:hypothetical protein